MAPERNGLLLEWPEAAALGASIAVTTRAGGVSEGPYASLNLGLHVGDDPAKVVVNRQRAAGAFGVNLSDLVFAEQVHGADACVVGPDAAGRGTLDMADAIAATDTLVTTASGLILVILVADCVPIALVDPVARVLAAVHAGWRGTAAGAVPRALDVMATLGAVPERVVAFIGPAVGPDRYQVDDPVYRALGDGCAPEPHWRRVWRWPTVPGTGGSTCPPPIASSYCWPGSFQSRKIFDCGVTTARTTTTSVTVPPGPAVASGCWPSSQAELGLNSGWTEHRCGPRPVACGGQMPPHDQRADRFVYDGVTVDPSSGEVCCSDSEREAIPSRSASSSVPRATGVPPRSRPPSASCFCWPALSLLQDHKRPASSTSGATATSRARARLPGRLLPCTVWSEFAYRGGLDLSGLSVVGPDAGDPSDAPDAGDPRPAGYTPVPGRPLIPFGGGIDSIVTVEALRAGNPDAALCIVHPPGDAFAAIEDAAAVAGLPVVRVARQIDAKVRRSDELGFFNGHVPITAVITAAAVVAAILGQRDAVVLSNEWSASIPTLVVDGRPINHQWSKGADFEQAFSAMVERSLGPGLSVFSYLRPRSELWVAQQFAGLTGYHATFRSCNRSFHQDPAQRLDHWCGVCDKCCFIDLMLAPFMSAAELGAVFYGSEPLDNPELEGRFATLLGLLPDTKPFECVGDVDECRAALSLAVDRPDRRDSRMLHALHALVADLPGSTGPTLLAPMGPHYIPDRYAPSDLLVRAR